MAGHSPTEHIQEEIHEHAHQAHHEKGRAWIAAAALTAAFLAAFAAVSGALATARLTESMRAQIEANDKWGEFQARSIKEKILELHQDLLASANKPLSDDAVRSLANARDRKPLRTEALALEERSERALETHEIMERAATFFHIAIAIVAIAVLTRRRAFFYLSLAVGSIGVAFFVLGLYLQAHIPRAAKEAPQTEQAAVRSAEPPPPPAAQR